MSGAATAERTALIEASLPLDAIARAVARDAAVSPLHLWWSHKPAPACRAALFASLVDDPGQGLPAEEAAAARAALSDLVARLSAGEDAALREARERLARAYPEGLPTVVDPFCGSGAIPCEAQRLGLPVFASDLNPVAVLATAALIDFPVRFARVPGVRPPADGPALSSRPSSPADPGAFGLPEDVRFYGRMVRDEARRRVGDLYPPSPTEEPVLAWLWCRTARCPNPACGAEMPLVHSFWLSTRPGKPAWVYPEVLDAAGPAGDAPGARTIRLRVGPAAGVPEPPAGTFTRGGAHCLACGQPVPLPALRRQARARGLGLRLLAMVGQARRGRRYLPPDPQHEALAARATPSWAPDTEIPERALGVGVAPYGLRRHRDLFAPRQLAALAAFSDAIRAVRERVEADARRSGLAGDGPGLAEGGRGASAYADAVCTYLAFALDRAAGKWCSLARWQRSRENIEHPFASPGLQMAWDFAEANPFSTATGNWLDAVDAVADALERAPREGPPPACRQMDAAAPDGLPAGGLVVCTDPPYFANLPYADTSDLFYVWLRRTLAGVFPDLLRTVLTPKDGELVADPHRYGGRAAARQRFLDGMRSALAHMRARARADRPMTVYYALRQARPGDGAGGAEGWAAMLESLLSAGFRITGTWPLRTEHAGRRRSLDSNALASTILLVCRPRAAEAPEAPLREVLRELRQELPRAVAQLAGAGVAPVDLAQAAIGPGMAVFSRYARVLAADGAPVSVAGALRLINEELDAALSQGEADLDAETRFCLAWFEQHGVDEGPYGDADVLARAKNTGVATLERLRLVEARAGRVRLLTAASTASDPAAGDARAAALRCAWLVLQRLIAALQRDGEAGAGAWLSEAPAETAAALRPLAYRVYAAAERRGLQAEARWCGGVVAAWDEIETRARRGARPLRLEDP